MEALFHVLFDRNFTFNRRTHERSSNSHRMNAALTFALRTPAYIWGVAVDSDPTNSQRQTMQETRTQSVKVPTPAIADNGRVRLGYMSPSLPPVRLSAETEDNGKVRIGYMSPSLPPVRVAPASTQDNGKVRIGYMSPVL
jgi:hypothetical protein